MNTTSVQFRLGGDDAWRRLTRRRRNPRLIYGYQLAGQTVVPVRRHDTNHLALPVASATGANGPAAAGGNTGGDPAMAPGWRDMGLAAVRSGSIP